MAYEKERFLHIVGNLKTPFHYVFSLKKNSQGWRNDGDEITLPSCHDVRDHAFMHATSHGKGS